MKGNTENRKSKKAPATGLLGRLSIKRKMVLIIMLVSSAAMFLAGGAFITYEWFSFRQRMVSDLSTQAKMLADNTAGALSFDDPEDASKVLESLRAKKPIAFACVYRSDGTVFATYRREALNLHVTAPKPQEDEYRFDRDRLVMFKGVILNDRPIGTVYLQSDLSELYASLRQSAFVLAVTITLSFIAAFFLSLKLQRVISGPVLSLAETAGEVSRKKDYSVRAAKHSEDEVGYLIDSFNDMLAQIQLQDHALKESEEKFRSLVETTSDRIWEMDKNGIYTYVSPRVHDILGYTTEEVVGKTPFELMPAYEADRISNFFKTKSASEEPFIGLENINIHKDGHEVILETSGVPFFNMDGTFCGYRGIDRDITERRLAQEALKKAYDELEERVRERTAKLEIANKELESFSYSVSHDLRAPLRAVDGFSEVLAEDHACRLDAEGRRVLGIIRDNTKKMGQLIEDILQFSRIGRRKMEVAEINMEAVANAVFHELKSMVHDRKIVCEVKSLPPARGTNFLIRQVFMNLLSNAIKFTEPRDETVIEIGGKTEESENIYYVKDNGVGFDTQYADKLFSVFQRLHGAEEFEGSGVGLAIVQRIIHRHGGRVWAEGVVGKEATFYFTLPGKGVGI